MAMEVVVSYPVLMHSFGFGDEGLASSIHDMLVIAVGEDMIVKALSFLMVLDEAA